MPVAMNISVIPVLWEETLKKRLEWPGGILKATEAGPHPRKFYLIGLESGLGMWTFRCYPGRSNVYSGLNHYSFMNLRKSVAPIRYNQPQSKQVSINPSDGKGLSMTWGRRIISLFPN
jgi:hypothetical protein